MNCRLEEWILINELIEMKWGENIVFDIIKLISKEKIINSKEMKIFNVNANYCVYQMPLVW